MFLVLGVILFNSTNYIDCTPKYFFKKIHTNGHDNTIHSYIVLEHLYRFSGWTFLRLLRVLVVLINNIDAGTRERGSCRLEF